MHKSVSITNTKEYHQLRGIFHSAVVKDIDFTHWYKRVRFIIKCDEYLGSDFPATGVFLLDFEGVRHFSLNFSKGIFNEDKIDETASVLLFNPTGLHEYTQECTNDKRKFYRVVLSGNGTVLNRNNQLTLLEIHFDALRILRVCDFEDIEPSWTYFTLDSKKKFYDMLKYKNKINLE